MEKRTREKIALALLVFLGLGIAFAMTRYIQIGHNWNIAAVHIDDYVGEMDGYSVVVYDGKMPSFVDTAMLIDSDKAAAEARRRAIENGIEATSEQVAADYRSKEADVLVLRTDELSFYDEPVILKAGKERIGVFSVEGRYQYGKLKTCAAYLEAHHVDRVVVISKDRVLENVQFGDADLLVFSCKASVPGSGEYRGSTYVVDCPNPGEVKAVIFAPNNMYTAKTIDDL